MSKLKAIKPKEAPQTKPKILVFGKAGVGKTYTALDFPSTYYIDTEGGATLPEYTEKLTKSGGAYFGIEQGSLSFDTILDEIKALATEKHDYKTLIIDSITKVYNTEIAKEAERLGDKDAFGASKKPAIAYMRQLISWIARIDMNVIMIAHETQEWSKGEAIGTTFDCFNKVEYELDLCLQIVKLGGDRKAYMRKSRLNAFPPETSMDWTYEEFAKRYGKSVIEEEAKEIVLATDGQLKEMEYLIETFNITQKQIDKWFDMFKCDSFTNMSTDNIEAIINKIKDSVTVKETK